MSALRPVFAAGAALSTLLIAGSALAGAPDDVPPNAVPGHCYQHVELPPVVETYQERVLDIPEHTATRTIPAVYGFEDKPVVIREGRVEHIMIPPTYRTVTETEVIRPETTRTEQIPARYELVTERVLVREAHTEWRRGYGPVSDPDMPRVHTDRDIVCLIEVPAQYDWVTRHVLRSPGRTVEITTPAEVRTRAREVIDQPAREETHEIPPIIRMVHERVVVQPERVETYTVPPTYRTVVKTRVVSPGRFEWREFACRHVRHGLRPQHDEGSDGERGAIDPALAPAYAGPPSGLAQNAPPQNALPQNGRGEHGVAADGSIKRLQTALAQRGYYGGPIDGLFTIPTGDALTRFQRDKDLPLGGFNFATAQALNLQ